VCEFNEAFAPCERRHNRQRQNQRGTWCGAVVGR
jgi:hypothetical protein